MRSADQGGLRAASVKSLHAARRKCAACRSIEQIGRHAWNCAEPMRPFPAQRRDGVKQGSRIGVPRLQKQIPFGSALHHAACIHDHHTIGNLCHDPHVMRDEDNGAAMVLLELADEFQDLRLHGHVQGCGRLIRNEKRGIAGERHGDDDPLAHAAESWCG